MNTEKIYYVYCYYDTRQEPNIPIYIGKGKKQRWLSHFKNTHNQLLDYKLKHILLETDKPAKVIKLHENLTNEEASTLELKYILEYGRLCDNSGTLCNFSTFSTDGSIGYKFSGKTLEEKQKFITNESLKLKEKRIKSRPILLNTIVGTLKVIKDLDIERRQYVIAECLDCGYRQQMRANCLIKLEKQCFRCVHNAMPIKNLDTNSYYLNKQECAKELNKNILTISKILENKSIFKTNLKQLSDLEDIKEYFKKYPNIVI